MQTTLHNSLFKLLPTPQPLHHSLHLLHSTDKLSHLRPRHKYLLHMPAHTQLSQLDHHSLAHVKSPISSRLRLIFSGKNRRFAVIPSASFKIWSVSTHVSGKITRLLELLVRSRSFHRVLFSSSGSTIALTIRDSPHTCSLLIGLRL